MSDEVCMSASGRCQFGLLFSLFVGMLFILRDRVRKIPRLLNRNIRLKARPVVDKGLQVQRKRASCVSFQ